ncbi:MAG: Processive diacylglycerol alpha-glucosyltransferase [Acidobacteria bacterium]|nr:Processive diacylglycerol alpha-glucosyltransferase [Acidobacteriota bacterium]
MPDESQNEIRARLLPMFPTSVVLGGLELQCLKTSEALRQAGLAAELLNYYDEDDRFDILHLFGSSENFHDLCRQAANRWPIVISAVSGSPSASRWRAPIWLTVSKLAEGVKLQTSYQRLRAVYHLASAVICLNQLEAQFLHVTYGVPRNRIEIISNGVDWRYFQADGESFIERFGVRDFVLYSGNIVRRKNPLQLARVLRQLNYPGVFIGGTLAAEQAYADAFAELMDRSPNLLWIRGLKHDDPLLADAYAAACVFCLPSTSETQSLSALEAMATGSPVILGDFPYAYQRPFEHCLRCDPDDENSLRACLEKALSDPAEHRARLPEDYSWSNVAEKIARVYKRVLCGRAG